MYPANVCKFYVFVLLKSASFFFLLFQPKFSKTDYSLLGKHKNVLDMKISTEVDQERLVCLVIHQNRKVQQKLIRKEYRCFFVFVVVCNKSGARTTASVLKQDPKT